MATSSFVPRQPPEWVVITGGGSGIGAMLVKHFAAKGFEVLTCGRRGSALQETLRSCGDLGCRVHVVTCNIGTVEGRQKLVQALPPTASLRLLVQNAAVGDPARLEQLRLDDWEEGLRVNVTAPLFLTQALLEHLKRGRGRILHLGTGVAFRAQLGTSIYGVTKAAFYRLYQQLNADLADLGITAGSLSPGIVDTEGVRDHVEKARRQSLPHVAFFDAAFREGRTTDPGRLMMLFDKVLSADDLTFKGHEWSLRDLDPPPESRGSGPSLATSALAAGTFGLLLGMLLGSRLSRM